MKKVMLGVMLVTCVLAHGQKVAGIKGGYNNSMLINNVDGADYSQSLRSWHAGFTANFPFAMIFSVQPSMIVTGKGSKVVHGDVNSSNYYVSSTNPFYLEVPVTFNLNFHLGSKTGFYVGMGPYFATGIGGKNTVRGKRDGTSFEYSRKIEYSSDDIKTVGVEEGAAYGRLRRFDYGAEFNAGIILSGFMVSTFYDWGGRPVQSMATTDSFRNRTFGISIGYMLGG
jgi:hypothetical protein